MSLLAGGKQAIGHAGSKIQIHESDIAHIALNSCEVATLSISIQEQAGSFQRNCECTACEILMTVKGLLLHAMIACNSPLHGQSSDSDPSAKGLLL